MLTIADSMAPDAGLAGPFLAVDQHGTGEAMQLPECARICSFSYSAQRQGPLRAVKDKKIRSVRTLGASLLAALASGSDTSSKVRCSRGEIYKIV